MQEQATRNALTHQRCGFDENDVRACENTDQLLDWKLEVERDLASLDNSISEAKGKAQATGEYADPTWFRRRLGYRKVLILLLAIINRQLSKLNKVHKQERALQFERVFVDNAKKMLPADLFQEILNKTHYDLNNSNYDTTEKSEQEESKNPSGSLRRFWGW